MQNWFDYSPKIIFMILLSTPNSSQCVPSNPDCRISLSSLQVLGGQQRTAGRRGGGGEAAAEAGAHSPQLLPQHGSM